MGSKEAVKIDANQIDILYTYTAGMCVPVCIYGQFSGVL